MDDQQEYADDVSKASVLCPLCHRAFVNLSIHNMVVHQNLPERRCTLCGQMFQSLGRLCNHLSKHTSSKRACCECYLPFEDSLALFLHMNNHLAHCIYPCSFCQKSFASRFGLLDHTEHDHPGSTFQGFDLSDSCSEDGCSFESKSPDLEGTSSNDESMTSQKLTVVLGANKYYEYKELKAKKLKKDNAKNSHSSPVHILDASEDVTMSPKVSQDNRNTNTSQISAGEIVLTDEISNENNLNQLNTHHFPSKTESTINLNKENTTLGTVDGSFLENSLGLVEPLEGSPVKDWSASFKKLIMALIKKASPCKGNGLNSINLFKDCSEQDDKDNDFGELWLEDTDFLMLNDGDDSDNLLIQTDISDCDLPHVEVDQSAIQAPVPVIKTPEEGKLCNDDINHPNDNSKLLVGIKGQQSAFRKLKRMLQKRSSGGQKSFRCRFCKKYLSNQKTLKYHELRHTGDLRFNCALCNKKFPALYLLKSHSAIHDGRATAARQAEERKKKDVGIGNTSLLQFNCHHCGRHWPRKVQVKNHLEVQSFCCGRDFGCQVMLAEHAQREHPGRTIFSCHLCPKAYTTDSSLKRHCNIYHKASTLRKAKSHHQCPACGYVTTTKHNLRRHERLNGCRQVIKTRDVK